MSLHIFANAVCIGCQGVKAHHRRCLHSWRSKGSKPMASQGAWVESSQSQWAKEHQNEPGCFLLSKRGTLTRQRTAGIHSRCLSPLMHLGMRGNPRGQGELMTQKKGLRSPNLVTMTEYSSSLCVLLTVMPVSVLMSIFLGSWLTCLWKSLCPKL